MNDFLKLDKAQVKKPIPNPKKDLELSPYNIPFGAVCEKFVGHDELRPIMEYVKWDKQQKTIVCTNAHILLHLTPKPFPNFKGLYYTPQYITKQLKSYANSFFKQTGLRYNDPTSQYDAIKKNLEGEQKATAEYPNYKAVIGKGDNPLKIDTQKLYWFSKVLNDYRFPVDWDGAGTIKKLPLLSATNQMVLRYKNDKGEYVYLGANSRFLSSTLQAMFWIGSDKLQNNVNEAWFMNESSNRAIIIDYWDTSKRRFDDKTFNGFLIMPVVLDDKSENAKIGNRDFETDFPMLNLIYDINENKILSNGKLYDIDENLGFKYKNLSQNTKKIVNKQKTEQKSKKISNLADRLKGLKLLLKAKPNNNLIKNRIKGLEILQDKIYKDDDLPF